MKIERRLRPLNSRVLFAWDGTDKFIPSADRFVRLIEDRCVYAVHAMPHESIYSYGSVSCESKEKPRQAQRIEDTFRHQTSLTSSLKDAYFEILFGDRITEITILAAQLQAKYIVMPKFVQSTFSKWVHGDLNETLAGKAPCPVIFLEAAIEAIPLTDVSSGFHQERS